MRTADITGVTGLEGACQYDDAWATVRFGWVRGLEWFPCRLPGNV